MERESDNMYGHSWDQNEEFSIEIYLDADDGLVYDDNDNRLEGMLDKTLWSRLVVNSVDHGELIITFNSQGYSDPGQCSGPPEYCYPPEYDEERTVVSVELLINDPDEKRTLLPKDLWQFCFNLYEDAIYDVELSYDDSGPEYEPGEE